MAPGAVQTKMNDNWEPQELTELISEIPLGRLADPKEIAAAAITYFQKKLAIPQALYCLLRAAGWNRNEDINSLPNFK